MDKKRLDEIAAIKSTTKEKLKGKKLTTLSTKDKDALLEAIAKMLCLL